MWLWFTETGKTKDPLHPVEAACKTYFTLLVCMLFCSINKACSLFIFTYKTGRKFKEVQTENLPTDFKFQRMENRLHQRRVSFSDPQSPKHHGSTGGKDDNAWNWLQRTTFHDEDTRDDEHATSVAAAAFAIHSLEESESRNLQKIREGPKSSRTQTMRRKEDNISSRRPSYGETSMKRSFGQDPRTKESAFPVSRPSGTSSPKPVSPALAAGYQKQKGISIQHKNVKTRSETWEKAKIGKIQKRYEKMKSKILSWECVKKIQAKLQMERKKRAVKQKRAMQMQSYRNKMAMVDMIAQGARENLEDKRRKEECEAREKANRIRKTGKIPVKCLCFNS